MYINEVFDQKLDNFLKLPRHDLHVFDDMALWRLCTTFSSSYGFIHTLYVYMSSRLEEQTVICDFVVFTRGSVRK